jgi:hypothetical protein
VGKILDKSGRGNHATQATAASRPVLSARVNLLTYSEDFSNAAWVAVATAGQITVNATTAPDGTLTADKLYEAAAGDGSVSHRRAINDSSVSSRKTFAAYAKKAERKRIYLFVNGPDNGGWFDLDLGTCGAATDYPGGAVSITSVGNGWYRCTLVPGAASGGAVVQLVVIGDAATTFDTRVGDGTSGIYIWGAQLETGSTATRYQRVTTASDYDSVGFPYYLKFDGVDDFLATAAFTVIPQPTTYHFGVNETFNNTNRHVFDGTAANRQFFIQSTAGAHIIFAGSQVVVSAFTGSAVNTVVFNGASSFHRVNGVAGANVNPGASGIDRLYLGANYVPGANLSFNLYSFILRGAASSASQIASAESYVNSKTGAY